MTVFRRVITADDEKLARRAAKGLVTIVDDDTQVLKSLSELVAYEGYLVRSFSSVAAFLAAETEPRFPGPRCVLSDMVMPKMNGLALQQQLPQNSDQALIFMSGMARVEQAAEAFRRGALHFLIKPVNDVELFKTIEEALEKSASVQLQQAWLDKQRALVSKLTVRELELANILPKGLAIKEIGAEMGISERAVKLHKKNLLEKLEIRTLFELIKIQKTGLFEASFAPKGS